MTSPLETTFSLLASKKSTEANDLLIAAIDVPVGGIQAHAVRSLLKKQQPASQLLIIRKWQELHPAAQESVFEQKHLIHETVRQCLERDEGELRKLALEVAVSISDFALIPIILELMEKSSGKVLSKLTHALRMLTDQFYEALKKEQTENLGPNLNTDNLYYQRKAVLQQMVATIHRIENFEEPELILESLLILAAPELPDIREMMASGNPGILNRLQQIFLHSKHQGVMQFILSSMSCRKPNTRVMDAIRMRKDPEFINFLLAEFPEKLNAIQSDNFGLIQSIRWLGDPESELPLILPAHHLGLIRLLMGVRLPVAIQMVILKWLIHNSSPEVRLAATEVLATLDQSSAENLINESLESEDPNVQAWATTQLRFQAGASSFEKLIARVDSDMPEVREAARSELESFDLDLMIKIFDETPLRIVRQAGMLLQKLDPEVYHKMAERLSDPIRGKRIRSAQAAFALGLHQNVSQSLMGLLGDSDPMVRRTAVEILGDVPKRNVYDMLYQMRNDKSPRVREAVIRSLQKIQSAFQQMQATGANGNKTNSQSGANAGDSAKAEVALTAASGQEG
ncbi:MAG: HEAT repeat domain-containing protein [Planctomycetaceae bacterium]|nr:HEAT repeat domain-containing protein [Planctomycetaceae bacterium]